MRKTWVDYSREYRLRHPDRIKALGIRRRKDPLYMAKKYSLDRNRIMRTYGLSPEVYAELVKTQTHCPICNIELNDKNRVIDHCHKLNKFRSLLCRNCNIALGNFKDSIESLLNAVEYLRKHGRS